MGSSWTRTESVPCLRRQILHHWATREVSNASFKIKCRPCTLAMFWLADSLGGSILNARRKHWLNYLARSDTHQCYLWPIWRPSWVFQLIARSTSTIFSHWGNFYAISICSAGQVWGILEAQRTIPRGLGVTCRLLLYNGKSRYKLLPESLFMRPMEASLHPVWPRIAKLFIQVQRICLQCRRQRRHGFDPWVGKIPWRRAWQPTPVFLPGESHGQRSLAGYAP